MDKFGLAVRLIKVDLNRPLNIPTPSLWVDTQGNCQIISKRNKQSIAIIDPLKGRYTLNKHEAHERFSVSPHILSIDIGLHTPTKRFDIFWLLPFISHYRSQLAEVFAASFLNQILL